MSEFMQIGGSLIVFGFVSLIFLGALLGFAFWLWMLIDLLKRDFPAERKNEKLLWVLVLLSLNFLGSIIYFFVVKAGESEDEGGK